MPALVYTLLLLFLQLVSPDKLQQGQTFTFQVNPQMRQITIHIDQLDAKGKKLQATAKLLPFMLDNEPCLHRASLSWSKGRLLTSFRDGDKELLARPLALPSVPLTALEGGRTYQLDPKVPTPPRDLKVEGRSSLRLQGRNFKSQDVHLELFCDPALGLVQARTDELSSELTYRLLRVEREAGGGAQIPRP